VSGENIDHQPESARVAGERLATFMRRLLALATIFCAVYVVLWLSTGHPRLAWAALAIAVFELVVGWGYRLARRGEIRRPALILSYALIGVALVGCVLLPTSYPIDMLVCAMAVTAALPHLESRDLHRLMTACLTAVAAITSVGVLAPDTMEIPIWARATIIIGTGVAACYLTFLLQWQHSAHLRQLVQRATDRLHELTSVQSQLVERERLSALGEAAAVVAHEVRNPLAVIVNVVELLRKEATLSDDARGLLVMQEDEALRLDRLVGDLLVLARPLEPRRRLMETAPLLAQAIDAVGPLCEKAGVRVALNADNLLPELFVDPDHLQLALVNLLQNAIQVSPRDSEIRLSAQPTEEGIAIVIEDSGPGIRQDLLPRIFEPFFTTRPTGSGLGLAIVSRVVKAHAGDVRVTSGVDRGARFELLFPTPHDARGPCPSDALLHRRVPADRPVTTPPAREIA
jgi:signal transduction histidine kinase